MTSRLNLLDRAISSVSPGWALSRLHARRRFENLLGGYEGARRDSKRWRWSSSREMSADRALLPDLSTLRARSRDLQRNNPLAGGAIKTVRTSVVGSGLYPKAKVDRDFLGLSNDQAQALEADFERVWRLWADSPECDMTSTQSFVELQDTVLGGTMGDGDCFSVQRYRERRGSSLGLKVQLISGPECSTPGFGGTGVNLGSAGDSVRTSEGNSIVAGVEKSGEGRPVAYHFQEDAQGLLPGSLRWIRVRAYDPSTGRRRVLHHYEKLEINQTRGQPYLAAVIEPLRGLGQYSDSELQAAVVGAAYTVFVKTEGGAGAAPIDDEGTDPESERKLESGTVVDLRPGEEIDVANPGRPNEAFDPFVQAVLRQVGTSLELPFEVLIKHFTASYSAARAALLEAWKMYRKRRAWLVRSFCQPYYEACLIESSARGLVSAPGLLTGNLEVLQAYFGSEWMGPTPGMLDPQREVGAAIDRIDNDLSTRQREAAEITGTDWEKNVRQRIFEEEVRRDGGLAGGGGAARPQLEPPNDAGDREGPSAPAAA